MNQSGEENLETGIPGARSSLRSKPAVKPPSLKELLVLFIVGLVVAAAVAGIVLAQTPVYESQALLLIDQPRAIAVSPNEGVIAKLGLLRLKYVGLVGTERISAPVAASLGVPEGLVERSTFAAAPPQSLLLVVTASSGHANLSQRMAQATADEVAQYADDEQASAGIAASLRFEFSVVDKARPATKVSPRLRRIAGSAAIAGLLVMVAGFVLLRLRTTSHL